MSDSSIQQLQGLLARVQERRSQPRPAPVPPVAPAAPPAAPAQLEAVVSERPEPPMDAPTIPPAAEAAAPSVDEMSFADLQSVPAGPPSVPVESAEPSPPPASEPAAEAAPTGVLQEPSTEIAHEVPQASGPVAAQQGELPSRTLLSFEELVARSLSLRARG